jgi:hypothetical protein
MQLNEKEYRTWIDTYFDFFPLKNVIAVSVISALLLYIIGLALSAIGDFFRLYIKTHAVYLALFGIVWSLSWIRWGHFEFFKLFNKFPINFGDSEKQKTIKNQLNKKLRIATNNYIMLIGSLIITGIFYIVAIFWIKNFHIKIFNLDIFFPLFIPIEWVQNIGGILILKIVVLIFFATIAGFICGTCAIQILIYVFDVFRFLSRNFYSKSPLTIRQKLKPITRFNLKITWAWFGGVSILVLAFYKKISFLNLSYLIFFSLLGLFMFFIPQIYFHNSLSKKKFELLEKVETSCEKIFNNLNKVYRKNKRDRLQDLNNLISVYNVFKEVPTWIFDYKIVSQLLFSAIIPFILAIIKDLIIKNIQ